MSKLLEAKKLTKVFHVGMPNEIIALNQIDLAMEKGDFICVMGPSGSGKTTLMNCLSALDRPTRGSVFINGKNIVMMNNTELSAYRRETLGYVFQSGHLIDEMTIFDNIATALTLQSKDAFVITKRVNELAKKFSIDHVLDHRASNCSGGERQRAAICRALANNPILIIADEPTGNLDSKSSHEFMDLMKKLNDEGVSIMIVTHDPMIASYGKKLIYVQDGMIHTTLEKKNLSQEEFFMEIMKINANEYTKKFFKFE